MNRLARAGLCLLISCCLGIGVFAYPAGARWRIHNGNDVTDMTAPPGATDKQTCTDRLRGASGWATFTQDPSAVELPDDALTEVNYEVWKAPPGFTNFSEANAVFDTEGNTIGWTFTEPGTSNEIPASLVVEFSTEARTELVTPVPLPGVADVWVFAAAPLSKALPGVAPGDVLGLKPLGGASWITLAAIDCDDTGEYEFSGFLGAVDDPPTVNVGDAGTSYNVRFSLTNGQGQTVQAKAAVAGVTFKAVSCSDYAGRPTDVIEMSTTGPSKLRFSASKDQFVYRWQTPTQPGCYRLKTIFDSGKHKVLAFDLN